MLWVTTDPGWELFGVSEDGAAAVEDDGWACSELETKEELADSEDSGLLLLAVEELFPVALQAAKRNKDINKVKRFFMGTC